MKNATAQFTIMPGKEAEAEAAIKKVAASVQEKEPGCIAYFWHRNIKDPAQILVFEIWEDDEALATHRTMPHMAEFQAHFGTVFDPSTVKITRYERIAAAQH